MSLGTAGKSARATHNVLVVLVLRRWWNEFKSSRLAAAGTTRAGAGLVRQSLCGCEEFLLVLNKRIQTALHRVRHSFERQFLLDACLALDRFGNGLCLQGCEL